MLSKQINKCHEAVIISVVSKGKIYVLDKNVRVWPLVDELTV